MAKLTFKRGRSRVEPLLFLAREREDGCRSKLCFRSDGRLLKNFRDVDAGRWRGWKTTGKTFLDLLARHTDEFGRVDRAAFEAEVVASFGPRGWAKVAR